MEALRATAAAAIHDYVEACIRENLNPQLAIMGLVSEVAAIVGSPA